MFTANGSFSKVLQLCDYPSKGNSKNAGIAKKICREAINFVQLLTPPDFFNVD